MRCQINAWDRDGSLAVEGLVCEKNTAVDNGGCIYAVGTAVLDSGTVMRDNVAYEGGCICERRTVGILLQESGAWEHYSSINSNDGRILLYNSIAASPRNTCPNSLRRSLLAGDRRAI